MARRRNTRRRNTRRRNPRRSTGLLVINPRRRNRRKKRRTTKRRSYRRRNTATRRNPRRRNTRRRNPRRRNTRRRNSVARRNPRRRNTRRRNKRRSRAGTKVVYRYRNKRRKNRRKNGRRRNPTLASSLRKIPFVGGVLANMTSFVPQALAGAISVEPTMWVAKFLGAYAPMVPASWIYGATGLLMAAAVKQFAPLAPAMRKDLAIAIASAAGGVAYYKMRVGADAPMASEVGLLEMHGIGPNMGALEVFPGALNGAYSDGMAYSVQPYSGAIYGV